MLKVGLTGGIASGKSLAADYFRTCGAHLIDADAVSRDVVLPGQPGWQKVVETFGSDILLPDKTIDRSKLGEMVFRHEEKRRILEALLHPLIMESIDRSVEQVARTAPGKIVMVEVPLLIECGYQDDYRKIVVVYADRDIQRGRLMQRNGYTRHEADQRLAAQMDIEEKVQFGDYVIKNNGTEGDLERRVREVYDSLLEDVRS